MQALAKINRDIHPLFKDVGKSIATGLIIGAITSTRAVPGLETADPVSSGFFAGVQQLAAIVLYHDRSDDHAETDWSLFVATHIFSVVASGGSKIAFTSSTTDYTPITLTAILIIGTTMAVLMRRIDEQLR